jgi:alpha-soluble NSF attachment protein
MGEEAKATQLMQEGENLLRRGSIWGFIDPSKKFEDAKEKFQKAANIFKMVRSWENAAKAFERVADMAEHLDAPHEVIAGKTEAADCLARFDKKRATQLYKVVATKNCEAGRFTRAAQVLESAGALLEEDGDIGGAVECYAKAAEYHSSDNANSKANKALEKVGFLSAELGNYGDAAKVFEQLGYSALESALLKFGARKHFLHAGFCFLAKGDPVAAQVGLQRYLAADPTLNNSREHKVLAELIEAVENNNVEAFTTALADYDRVMTLDRWETSTLLRVKKSLDDMATAEPDLR